MSCLTRTLPAKRSELRVVCFELGTESFAADVEDIEAISSPLPIIPTPDLPASVEGEMYFRHSRMPVISMRRRLGMPARPLDDDTRVLIFETKNGPVGLLVDKLSEVQKLPPGAIQPPTDGFPNYIRAVIADRKGNLLLPDFERLTEGSDGASLT